MTGTPTAVAAATPLAVSDTLEAKHDRELAAAVWQSARIADSLRIAQQLRDRGDNAGSRRLIKETNKVLDQTRMIVRGLW